jgi:hypothetical protein
MTGGMLFRRIVRAVRQECVRPLVGGVMGHYDAPALGTRKASAIAICQVVGK